MKSFLIRFILLVLVFLAFGVNTDEDEVEEADSEEEVPVEDNEDEKPDPDSEEQTKDPEETESVVETETEDTEEDTPPPTAPWKRLPVATKIPVNYDIDLPQDI